VVDMETEQRQGPGRGFFFSVGAFMIVVGVLVAAALVVPLQPRLQLNVPTTTFSSSGVTVTIPSGAGTPSGAPGYSPDTIIVVVGVNNTVTFQNADTVPHTVTADDGSFNSGNLNAGQSWTHTFSTPGTFSFHCEYHSWMKGTIVVRQGTGASPLTVHIPQGSGTPSGAPGYSPDRIVLVVGVNNTVTFVNDDTVPHTVTATDNSFNSGNMNPGQTWTHTFTTPGTFTYHCLYHSWMQGTIVVKSPTG
jgi:plastocyanin